MTHASRRTSTLREFQSIKRILLFMTLLPLSGCAHYAFAHDELTRPESDANSWAPGNMHVELTAPAKGYYLASTKRSPGQAFGDYRPYLLVDVGAQNPLFAISTIDIGRTSQINPDAPYDPCRPGASVAPGVVPCQFTVELATPLAFDLFWDAFTNDAPIVDTDYTFGVDLTGRISLVQNHEQRFRAYWGHISTHIGDEYFNSARRDSIPFPRINPSYFPWRVGGSDRWYYQRQVGQVFNSFVELGAQVEGSCLFGCTTVGYYQVDTTQTDGVAIPLIHNGIEYNATLDWKWFVNRSAAAAIGPQVRPNSINVALLVGRRRVFPYLNPPSVPAYDPALNFVLGYSFSQGRAGLPADLELYGRLYHGPNPYGQLRNQENFNIMAVGVRFH